MEWIKLARFLPVSFPETRYQEKPSSSSPASAAVSPIRLRVRVISGQHLPKSEEEQKLKGDTIQPYVKV